MAVKFLLSLNFTFLFVCAQTYADDQVCRQSSEEVLKKVEYLNQIRFCQNVNVEACQARLGLGAAGVGGAVAGLVAAGASRLSSVPLPEGVCVTEFLLPMGSKSFFSFFLQTILVNRMAEAKGCVSMGDFLKRNPQFMSVMADQQMRLAQQEIAKQLEQASERIGALVGEKLQASAKTVQDRLTEEIIKQLDMEKVKYDHPLPRRLLGYMKELNEADFQSELNRIMPGALDTEAQYQKIKVIRQQVQDAMLKESSARNELQGFIQNVGKQEVNQKRLIAGLDEFVTKHPELKEIVETVKAESRVLQELRHKSGQIHLMQGRLGVMSAKLGTLIGKTTDASEKFLTQLKKEMHDLAAMGVSNAEMDSNRSRMLSQFVEIERGGSLANSATKQAGELAVGEQMTHRLAQSGARGVATRRLWSAAVMGTGVVGITAQAAVAAVEPTTMGCGARGGNYVKRDSDCAIVPGLHSQMNQFLSLNPYDQLSELRSEPELCRALTSTYESMRSPVIGSCKSRAEAEIVIRENAAFAGETGVQKIRIRQNGQNFSYVLTNNMNGFCGTSNDGYDLTVVGTGRVGLNQECIARAGLQSRRASRDMLPSGSNPVSAQTRAYGLALSETSTYMARAAACCAGNPEQCQWMNMKMATNNAPGNASSRGIRD